MKRVFFWIGSGVLAATVVLLTTFTNVQAQGVNSFEISSFDIQYKLDKDAEGRSTLITKETITAYFPHERTNRGIERSLPHMYKEHPTSLKIVSVENATGERHEYSTHKRGDTTTLRIGDPDRYVHGTVTYVITYTQKDVTHLFDDTKSNEWYWDTNGVSWRVPTQLLTVSVVLSEAVQADLRGVPRCYQGVAGATAQCELMKGEGGTYTVTATNLTPGENVTVAFGFSEDAFAPYKKSLLDTLIEWWAVSFLVSVPVAAGLLIFLSVRYSQMRNRSTETKIVPAEYIPPRGVSVTTAGQIILPSGSVFSAQLIDLAVRRYLAIIELKPKRGWVAAEYAIEMLRKPGELLAEEQEVLSDMFGHLPKVGERLSLKSLQHDYAYASRTIDNDAKLTALIHGEYGLRTATPPKEVQQYFRKWSTILVIVGVVLLSPLIGFTALFAFIFGQTIKPLTDKGVELRRYLFGLSKYIKAAEKERLKMLQGPDTAQKVGKAVDVSDSAQLVKLYERVLPYAILFGHEKEWSKRLGAFYEKANQTPAWYSGADASAFNAAAFVAAMNSFSYAASSSSGSSSSSSSGGSSGGGSSGGGGGGGGGGGW